MQVNSIGALNTVKATNFGSKEKEGQKCKTHDNSFVTIPRVVYAALLAAVLGGPLSSCNKDDDPLATIPMVPTTEDTTRTTPDSIAPAPVDSSTIQSPVQKQLAAITSALNLATVEAYGAYGNSAIHVGDMIEMGYHDGVANTDIKLKVNTDLSTKDKMVYDGTSTDCEFGDVLYVRHTITQSSDGIIVKKARTKLGKPPSENTGWIDTGTYKYVATSSGVDEFNVNADGTATHVAKYVSKTLNSVTRKNDDGSAYDLTNILLVKKKKDVDTGVHEVHM